MWRNVVLGLLSAFIVVAGVAPATAGHEGAGPPRQLVIELRSGSSPAAASRALAGQGIELVATTPGSRFVLGRTPADARPRPGGEIVAVHEPVVLRTAAFTPDDPHFPLQWHLSDVQAGQAWELATGAGVTVAVIDTGVARDAPDLAGTAFTAGYDWVDNDSDPTDQNGHGTHVTGTVAQTTNNARGTAGLAFGSTIMPLRALDANGAGIDYNIAAAIRYAADREVAVINLSLGAPGGSPVLQDAVRYAALRGVTVVGAAGNEGAQTVAFPAAYEEVIAVGATRIDRRRPAYSNTGAALDLVAPGGDLSVDQNGDGHGDGVLQQSFTVQRPGVFCYCFYQGTSMAAPHVAASAALIASTGARDPGVIRRALLASASDLGTAGRDDEYGHGLVQAFDAIQAANAAEPAPVPAPVPAPAPAPAPEPAPPATPTPDPVPAPAGARPIGEACPEGRVPRDRFGDVDPAGAHALAVDCVAWLGIASGTGATTFGPGATVSRAQMASFLARLIERSGYALPGDPPDAFDDDDGSTHEARIDQLSAVGVVRGGLDRTYRPREPVSRAAMASFLARTHDLIAARALDPAADAFDDDAGNVHEEQIDRVAAVGIAAGTGPRLFSPAVHVRRDQMATFLTRTYALLVSTGDAPAP